MDRFCRGCLIQYNEPTDLLQYTEKNRRLFVYVTGLQVKRNDTFTFQLCKECYFQLKQSCKFKKQCRTSDKKFRNYLMLKEDGDDFGSFIKNMDENLSFRLPFVSGHSTPAHQKNKDDDNESTCTSIQNFMTDILDGEEMAPTEERIIREVIEEEADILDDSLDSHWLQDDFDAASDIDVDFGISPFCTPRSQSYTPRSIDQAKHREINFLTSKEIIEKPRISQKFDMPILEAMDLDQVDMPFKRIGAEYYETEAKDEKERKESEEPDLQFDNSIPSEVEDMVTENSISSTLKCFNTDILTELELKKEMTLENDNSNFVTFDETEMAIKENQTLKIADSLSIDDENAVCIVLNQGTATEKSDVPLTNELDYYVNKAELKRKIASTVVGKEYHCTIDRNLAIVLKNEGKTEIPLDQLIESPAVSVHSGMPTPTIHNILFGDKGTTPKINDILLGETLNLENAPKYFPQVGQSVEDFDDDDESDVLKSFLKDDGNMLKDDETNDKIAVPTEPEDNLDFDDGQKLLQEINHGEIKTEDHIEVLEELLRESDDAPSKLNEEIIDNLIDPHELNKLSDEDLFKRPLTPPYDKYDLEKLLCKICQRPFDTLKSLKIHFAKTHNYKFPNADPHRNKFQNSQVKLCNVCGKGIKGAANYFRHMRSHSDDSDGTFQCDNCTLFFKSRMALLVHMRVHKNMAPVKKKENLMCHICGKVSSSRSHHKLHLRRHLKEISVTCDFCNKGFYGINELKEHIRISHEGERPYKCHHCSNSYKKRESLNTHMKRYLGIFEYKCNTCDVGFVTKNHLISHYNSIRCRMKRQEASHGKENGTKDLSTK